MDIHGHYAQPVFGIHRPDGHAGPAHGLEKPFPLHVGAAQVVKEGFDEGEHTGCVQHLGQGVDT